VLAYAADAKARIAVYGSAPVVHALAAFEKAGPTLDNPPSTACFLNVVSAMRMQAGNAAWKKTSKPCSSVQKLSPPGNRSLASSLQVYPLFKQPQWMAR
jgi:hypothetical protein